eukprot:7897-Amphidinium_carterae.1
MFGEFASSHYLLLLGHPSMCMFVDVFFDGGFVDNTATFCWVVVMTNDKRAGQKTPTNATTSTATHLQKLGQQYAPVSYTHLRAHETEADL